MPEPTPDQLSGTVLLPRGGAWGERAGAAVRARAGTPWVVPLLRITPVNSPEVAEARAVLAAGDVEWLVVTSAATVDLVRDWRIDAKVAAVGPATASTLREAGIAVDLVPEHTYSATGLLRVWPTDTAVERVLLLRSDLARATLADGLAAQGCEVRDVVGYHTTAAPVSEDDAAAVRSGRADAVLVTSGSVARALAALNPPASTVVVSIGPVTTGEAREAGLTVTAEAGERTLEAMLDALAAAQEEKP